MKLTKEQVAILLYGFRMGPGGELTAEDIVKLPTVMKKMETILQESKGDELTKEVDLDLDGDVGLVRKLWSEGLVPLRDLVPRTQNLFDNVAAVTDALKE